MTVPGAGNTEWQHLNPLVLKFLSNWEEGTQIKNKDNMDLEGNGYQNNGMNICPMVHLRIRC